MESEVVRLKREQMLRDGYCVIEEVVSEHVEHRGRVGVHAGHLLCGVIEDTNPRNGGGGAHISTIQERRWA